MKLLVLDLGAPGGVDRLRSALVSQSYAVDVVTDPAVAAWLAQDPAVAAVLAVAPAVGAPLVEWCARLRAAAVWVPLGVLVDEVSPTGVVDLLDAGADDVVSRPVRFSEIAARVRALARRGRPERPTVLEAGELRLEPADRRVWRGEVEIDLTPKEFALLHVLMRNPGRVLSRELLLESAWDRSLEPVSNVVDQCIGHLRRRIDVPFGTRDLETVRGAGYRLRAA